MNSHPLFLYTLFMKTLLSTDEKVIKEGPANLQKIVWTKGGRLYLTNKRLVFEPHAFNININKELVANLQDIKNVRKSWTKFLMIPLLPNSIRVETTSGNYGFVVFKKLDWIEKINTLL